MPTTLNRKRRHVRKADVYLPGRYVSNTLTPAQIKALEKRRLKALDKAYSEGRRVERIKKEAYKEIDKEVRQIESLLRSGELSEAQRRGLEKLVGDLAKEQVKIATTDNILPIALPPKVEVPKFKFTKYKDEYGNTITKIPSDIKFKVVKEPKEPKKQLNLKFAKYRDEYGKLHYGKPPAKATTEGILSDDDELLRELDEQLSEHATNLKHNLIKPKDEDLLKAEAKVLEDEAKAIEELADHQKLLRELEYPYGEQGLTDIFGQGEYTPTVRHLHRRLLLNHALHQIRHHY